MANAYKVLGQSNPSAATLTTIYDTPSATEAVVSTFVACNRSSTTACAIRLAIRVADGVIADEDYLYYDLTIPANETFMATVGMTLAATDAVDVYTDNATMSFTLFGSEIT